MAIKVIKRLFSGSTPVVVLSVLLLVSLYLMGDATQGSVKFGRLYSTLLVVNVLGALILVVMIGSHLYRLYRHYRSGVTGSRLTVRLLGVFILLAVVPVSVVYYFSVSFLHRGIDSWFDVRIEQALQDSLELSRTALDTRMRDLLRQLELMSVELGDVDAGISPLLLDDLRQQSNAAEMLLFTSSRIIAASSEDPVDFVPSRPNAAVLADLRQSGQHVGLDPITDRGLNIRVIVRVPVIESLGEAHYLQGLYPVARRHSTLAASVQEAYAKYKELAYLRKPLKYSFTLTLSLVLLLTLLTAVWGAFFSARRLAAPIRDLAEGTRAVAAGNYRARLPQPMVEDELGFLVRSFNEMTERVYQSQEEAQRSHAQVEAQRAYLEALLGSLSSGVFSLDGLLRVRTVNAAASQILGEDLTVCIGDAFETIGTRYPVLQEFIDDVMPHLVGNVSEWREELSISSAAGTKIFMCRGAGLSSSDGLRGGYVIVFDDITGLVQAQRNAAWGEVARRLAHEIKNPLTPIQLSAERLRHKYLNKMPAGEAEALDRYTTTIVQQVEQMKEMVNAFSEYARAPQMKLQAVDVNRLVEDVLLMYRGDTRSVDLQTRLEDCLPSVQADDARLRQVLHNLLKNALEAMEGQANACVTITSRCVSEAACRFVELSIEDNGPGVPEELMGQVFDPYVTTKTKGSGLGLAIVKKIVEEHGGVLSVDNLTDGGARFILKLPVTAGAEPDAGKDKTG